MGPVISAEQQERVLGFIERATDAKATIVTGGESTGDRGFFVKPTIVTDVDQKAEIVQNEVFGPVITMQSAASDDGAIEMANDVRYGLAASVFSRERRAGAEGRREARLRHRLGERAPLPAHLGDAARRLQGVGLRQGHVHLLDGGVHADQARLREARRVTERASGSPWTIKSSSWHATPRRATTPTAADVAENVVKRFDEAVAVDGISVEIPRGSFFALLGPSGCGKTTTLRMIGGFEEPTEGRIFLGDQDVVGLPPYKRDVNTVFQSYALFPHMTIEDNVAFGLERKGVPEGAAEGKGRGDARARRPHRLRQAQAQAALGRAAAARRTRPRAREPTTCPPSRRAVRRARPQAAKEHAAGAQADPAGGRDHVRPRHARPGGGDDDGRHDRGHERRQDRAARPAGGALRAPRDRVRRRVPRRLESPAGHDRGLGRDPPRRRHARPDGGERTHRRRSPPASARRRSRSVPEAVPTSLPAPSRKRRTSALRRRWSSGRLSASSRCSRRTWTREGGPRARDQLSY